MAEPMAITWKQGEVTGKIDVPAEAKASSLQGQTTHNANTN